MTNDKCKMEKGEWYGGREGAMTRRDREEDDHGEDNERAAASSRGSSGLGSDGPPEKRVIVFAINCCMRIGMVD
jgi:hypothetical protein